MSRVYLTPINLSGNEVQNVNLQNLGTAPSSPTAGRVYYDTVSAFSLVWNGSAWVDSRARSTHSGTQLAATISNLSATVQAYSLSSFATPTTNIAMGGFKLTGLATPTVSGDSAEYSWVVAQVQSAAAGISSKDPVVAVSAVNIASLSGLPTVDGVTLTTGQRLLLIAQTTASQNGVWNVTSGAWTRPVVEGATAELDVGAMWLVTQGTVNTGTQWRMSTTGSITIGTTSISIVQFGAGNSYTAGNGLTLTGSAFSVNPAASGGIAVAAGGTSVDSTVARVYTSTIGDGTTTPIVVTHALNKQYCTLQVKRATSPFDVVECDMQNTSATTATFVFAVAPTTAQFVVTCVG